VMLVPRELDLIEAGRHMPLPTPRPKTVEIATKHDGKGNVAMVNSDLQRRAATRSARPAVPDPWRRCPPNLCRRPHV
jgi:hypothetical protein